MQVFELPANDTAVSAGSVQVTWQALGLDWLVVTNSNAS
jgi:hypothetical protein